MAKGPGSNGQAPILLKRRKVVGGEGHHGGAWKVAYADFVTAMMAFFLLMWLLNATTEQQRKGIADYFAPEIPLARVSGGSDGMFGGDSPTSPGPLAAAGAEAAPAASPLPAPPLGEAPGAAGAEAAETAALAQLEDALLGRGGESLLSDEALAHVVTRLTDEGLVIEIYALEGAPLFEPGTARERPVTAEILGLVASLARLVENRVAVAGHLAAAPGGGAGPGGGAAAPGGGAAWALSGGRADRARRLLEAGGLDPLRVARVAGHADRSPVVADPAAPRNDRIEVIFLREGRRA